jgi:TP901 family phage tail tape measure protein
MADVNANIGVNIDTSDALAQLKNLQRQISQFHSSVAKSSSTAAVAQRDLQKNFLNSVNAIEGFSAELKTVRTTAESFSNSLEKNKLSMREYFRFAASQSKTFGKNFGAEFSTIEKTAIERVKTLQTQYVKMGRDASGAMQAIAIRPTVLNMKDLGTQTAIAAQKQVIFNQLVKQGSTNLLNFGKNTQWAGRQLMVGFTLPLATLGMTAGRVFMDMEKAAIKFKKVYGDLFTAPGETEQAMEAIVELGKTYTAYGIAVSESLDIAADAAAAGFAGVDLQNQTNAALKLSVLGQLSLQKALETTISLQNAFGLSSAQLSEEIDFLNAVENQTVVALDDITEAIPRVAPVIKALGGDVRDLAFFMAAMKEGGVNAAQGANALKSGLASLINPTQVATDMLVGYGINLRAIINTNQGDLNGIVVGFAKALDTLDPVNRARAIEQLFGKFQFARMSTLFTNVAKDGTQASRVLDLAGASIEELAALSEGELGVAAASSMNKFLSAVENIKLALAPIGETFLQIATPIVEFGTKMLDAFNGLPDGIKKSIATVITVIGGIGPIALMTFGLINNGIANMIKFFATVRLGYLRITGQAKGVGDETQYMTNEQLEAAAAAASLDQAHSNLTQRFTAEKVAVDALRASYEAAVAAGNRFAMLNPGMMKPGRSAAASAPRMAKGGILKGPGTGTSDSILSWLSNGEAVIPAEVVKENPELIEALVKGGLKIPGFAQGTTGLQMSLPGGAELAHFSKPVEMLGKDLVALARAAHDAGKATQTELQAVINAVGDNLDGVFKTFDSRVERLSSELNQMVGEEGSGKTAPKALVQRDLVERGADARLPLVDRMRQQGVSQEDAVVKADKVTQEIERRMDLLGDEVVMTAEDISKLTQEAYEAVAAVDEDVARAHEAMKQIQVFKDETGDRGARGTRKAFGQEAYTKQKGRIRTQAKKIDGGSAYTQGAFKTTPEMAQIAEMTELEIQQMFRAIPEQLKQTVHSELKNGTAAFVSALIKASEDGAVEGIKTSTQQASPSKKARTAGENIGKGAIDGIESQVEEAKVAGTQVAVAAVDGVEAGAQAAPARRGPRRASSGGDVIWDSQAKQYQNQAKMAQILEGRQKGLARAADMNLNAIGKTSQKLTGFGFAISSAAGVASMFGGKVGEFASIIMQVTSLFTLLAGTTMALVKAQTAQATMMSVMQLSRGKGMMRGGRALPGLAAPAAGASAGGIAGGAKGLAGLNNIIKNVVGVFMQFLGLGKLLTAGFVRMIPVVGWIITGLGALALIFQKSNEAINALGDTANLSGKKIEKLADIFNVTARSADFASKFTGTSAETAEERNKVEMVLESENFKKDFQANIDAVKGASQQDAERVLNSLAVQLSASGFESDAVQAIIDAIVIESGQKDLNLKFASIDFKSEEGLANMDKLAKDSADRLKGSFAKQDFSDVLFGWFGGGQLNTQVQTAAGEFTTLFQALQIGFAEGEISSEDFNAQLANLNTQVNSLDPSAAEKLVDVLADNLGIKDKVKGLDNFNDKMLLINATAAGVEIPQKVVRSLEKASKAGASKKDLETAIKLRKEINELIKTETELKEEQRKQEELQEMQTASVEEARNQIAEQVKVLENQSAAYDILIEAGFGAADAINIVSDAAIAQGLAMASSAAERQNLINDIIRLKNLESASEKRTQAATGGGGGGASKSPMQEAMEDLGKQRTEIKNNIAAYAGLRKAGFSAAQAADAAGDATLAAALASTQVGSSQWKALVNQIRLVRIEALKTSEGLRNAFDGLKSQADEYYDILERQVERKYADGLKAAEKQATMLNRAIEDLTDITDEYQEEVEGIQRDIEIQFDRPIEALNEETSDLANDLALMDREADKITKRYDEQAEALDRVNKINQRIIAQQKQQIGLSSALVEGDIAAAAAAVQDIRAANASEAGQSQADMLDVAKQAELDALRSESGMSRLEIEERQFEISQEIYELEEQREDKLEKIRVIEDKIYKIQQTQIKPLEKQLKANEDMVQAIEDQKDAELETIDAQRQKWEDAELALDNARIEAGEFNNVIDMAKNLTGDVVANWKELANKTITLTIDTVMKEIGGAPTDAAIVQESGSGGGGGGRNQIPEEIEVDEETAVTEEEAKSPIQKAFDWLSEQGGNFGDWWNDLFGSIGTWLSEQWTAFTTWLSSLPGKIGEFGSSVWSGIQSIPTWLGEQWEGFKTWLSELPYNIGVGAGMLWGEIQNVGDWLGTQWENFKTWVTVTLPNGVKQWGANTWASIQTVGAWLATQWENFKTWLTVTLPAGIKQWGANTWASIQNIPEWLATQWERFKTWLTVTLPNGVVSWAKNLWTNGLPNLGAWLAAKAEELRLWIVSLPGKIGNWAKNLWDGFWSGFKAGEEKTRNKATGGMIYRNRGGDVPGVGNTDTVSAMLTPGEFVVNKRSTAKYRSALKAMNAGTFGGGMAANRYKVKPPKYLPPKLSDQRYGLQTKDYVPPSIPKQVYNLPTKDYSPSNLAGQVYNLPTKDYSPAGNQGSVFKSQANTSAQMDNSVYNYSLSVNVNGSNVNANDIASTVIEKIKKIDSQRLRRQVVS